MPTGPTAHKIVGFSNREHDPELQVDASSVALWARDGLHRVGHIRLGSEIELHIRVDGEIVTAFPAHASAFTVALEGAGIYDKLAGLADGAPHRREPGGHFFY